MSDSVLRQCSRKLRLGQMETKKYVVDTSLINQLVDGVVEPDELPKDGTFVASHVQRDEIDQTTDEKRRSELRQKFTEIIELEIPTDTFALDISRMDEGNANLGDGKFYETLKAALDSLKAKPNNSQDALIAETAKKEGYVLLTADHNLNKVALAHAIVTQYWRSVHSKKSYPV